jgi:transposase InsO family protein
MGGLLRQGNDDLKFNFIDAEKALFPVSMLCRELGVSRSGYYARQDRPASKREQEDERLKLLVQMAHREGRRYYGRPMVHAALKRLGEHVSAKRVGRLMREEGLKGKGRRRFARTTDSNHSQPVFENLLGRDFTANAPNQRWVADTTYLRIPDGFLYLAVVMDLFSRRIVGWALGTINDRGLVMAALEKALTQRCPKPGLLHHSDRGSQYASADYQTLLATNGITCSMSRPGDCFDNAAMESWFGTLKSQEGEDFASHFEAQRKLFDYIEVFYNRKRMHSSLDYVSPHEFERAASAEAAA